MRRKNQSFAGGFTYVVLTLLIIVVVSCDKVEDPLAEVPPDTVITLGPADGTVVTEPSVSFQWEGSNRFVGEFSYRCSPYQAEWSLWSSDRSITYYLDEGDYLFEVMGRYESGNEDDTPVQRVFTVDFPGPGILIKPLRQEVTPGQEFTIHVFVNDVADLMLVHLSLKFGPSVLQALDAIPGEVFQVGSPPVFFKKINNFDGIVDIDISTVNARPSRINGTADIAVIRFRSLSTGKSSVTLEDGSELRDSGNRIIDVVSRFGCVVEATAE
ncbi:hypothetical protein ACFL6S_22135 [Candidatus Poribacteria bacterium]